LNNLDIRGGHMHTLSHLYTFPPACSRSPIWTRHSTRHNTQCNAILKNPCARAPKHMVKRMRSTNPIIPSARTLDLCHSIFGMHHTHCWWPLEELLLPSHPYLSFLYCLTYHFHFVSYHLSSPGMILLQEKKRLWQAKRLVVFRSDCNSATRCKCKQSKCNGEKNDALIIIFWC
jgi:hypothetical protein